MSKKRLSLAELNTVIGVADYLRLKGDTANALWYDFALKMFKTRVERNRNEFEMRSGELFEAGRCYYYRKKYSEASTLLSKAIAAKDQNPCAEYFLELSNVHLGIGLGDEKKRP